MTAEEGANGGWIWPGRGAFRVQTRAVHASYQEAHQKAPANRKDFYEGSVNFRWKSGVDVAQPAFMGDHHIQLEKLEPFQEGGYVWVAAANSDLMFQEQGVQEKDRHCVHMRQQIFRVKGIDSGRSAIILDNPLEFNLYEDSTSDGSKDLGCKGPAGKSRVVPLSTLQGVGFENFYLTQVVEGHAPEEAKFNYHNIIPEAAMHGIVWNWAANGFVRNVRTYMTGSHPIVTEGAKNMQFEGNQLHGSWNKGKGGNGYFRNSKVWNSLIVGNTLTGLRHLTLQWSASGNLVKGNRLDCDLNLHGGWERNNLIEGNIVNVPFGHRDCSPSCGSGDGTWYPIWWAAGHHAGGWSGASGPRNIFFNNILKKQRTEDGPFETFEPYGANSKTLYQFGWDQLTVAGVTWMPLSVDGKDILTWTHERQDFIASGVNANCQYDGPTLAGVDYLPGCKKHGPTTGTQPVPAPPSWCQKGTLHSSETYCCGPCGGQCGGPGCGKLPGRADQCCTSTFQDTCADHEDTVCIIPAV